MKMPKINIEFSTEVLTGTGPANGKELPLPTFTITVTPTGIIQLPELPNPRTQTEEVKIPNLPEDSTPSETDLPGNSDFDNDTIREGRFENQQQIEFPSDHPYPRRPGPYRPQKEDNPGRDRPQFPGKQEFPHNQRNTPTWNNNSGGSGGSSDDNPVKKGRGQ